MLVGGFRVTWDSLYETDTKDGLQYVNVWDRTGEGGVLLCRPARNETEGSVQVENLLSIRKIFSLSRRTVL
jgi:hypothetical protein